MRWLLLSGAVLAAGFAAAHRVPDGGRALHGLVPLYWGLIVAYALACWRVGRTDPGLPSRWAWIVLGGGAVLFRILVLPTEPFLSDDVYRYLWDGRVLAEGINPYRYPPLAPELAPLRDDLWTRINHPELPTIYPPLLMLAFGAVAAIAPTVLVWKTAMALADLAAGLFLALALARAGRSSLGAVIWLWHPLVILEFAGSGHGDALGIALVAVAVWLTGSRRFLGSGLAWTLAGLVKFLPWVVLPLLVPRLRWRWFLLPILVVAVYSPFLAGNVDALGSLRTYAATWRANDLAFGLLLPEGPVTEDGLRRGKLLAAGAAAAVWLIAVVRRRPAVEVYGWTVGTALLLSPVVHPWYVLWLLPAAMLGRQPAWWIWSITVALAYHPLPGYLEHGVWQERTGIKVVEYVPVYAAVLLALLSGGLRARLPGIRTR